MIYVNISTKYLCIDIGSGVYNAERLAHAGRGGRAYTQQHAPIVLGITRNAYVYTNGYSNKDIKCTHFYIPHLSWAGRLA